MRPQYLHIFFLSALAPTMALVAAPNPFCTMPVLRVCASKMILQAPPFIKAGGDSDDDDDDAQDPMAQLPALRSAKAQAMLKAKAAAAEAEERQLHAHMQELREEVKRLKAEQHDLESRLFYAGKTFRTAEAEQKQLELAATQAEAYRDSQADGEQGLFAWLRPVKRANLERLNDECRQLRAAADTAADLTAEKRSARAELASKARLALLEADKAVVAVTQAAEAVAAASMRADEIYSEAYAQARVRSEMADDALSVVASSAILVDAILPAAGEAVAAALGFERKDTAEQRAARKRKEREREERRKYAEQQQNEAERVLACAADDHQGVLQVSADADIVELRQAYWARVQLLHPELCQSPLAATSLDRCTKAFAALGGGTWAAQEELEAAAQELGLQVERKSYFQYIPPP